MGHWLLSPTDRAATPPGTETTLTVTLFSGGHTALTRIGDSRAFRLHGSQLRRITEDHTIGNLIVMSVCSR
jgi:serine/threonine protein phosphatase PrpC